MRVNSLSIEMSSHNARQCSSICFCLHILYILHILYLHIHTVMYSVHLSAFVCTYFTHSEERARENVFLWGDNLKDNWWALCKDLQCLKTQILKYTNWQSERCLPADEASAKISNIIQIQSETIWEMTCCWWSICKDLVCTKREFLSFKT